MAGKPKKISREKFEEALDNFLQGKWSIKKCSEHCGISVPTLSKWFEVCLHGEILPDIFL